ncbi:MAG: hypothetical protein PHI01_02375 [Candidatus Izemoplasmatales bacterium]|nr:hypothetical protein [Candidatus Izemoplasmatales bacterium]
METFVGNCDADYLKLFSRIVGVSLFFEYIIHSLSYFSANALFGGSRPSKGRVAILKTIAINENLLQWIDNAIHSSMEIRVIIIMNGMLSEIDKKKSVI